MDSTQKRKVSYGMVIDLDRCLGCGTCMVACAQENNVPLTPMKADARRGITWMNVVKTNNQKGFPDIESVHIPMPCQQCDDPPCVHVCFATAVELDHRSGIVTQVPVRCVGCRYCLAACPYHARYFNWWDPKWPSDKVLNPDVSPRMRGVAEKCNFCHGRLQRAHEKAQALGRKELEPGEYVTACVEACPSKAITFGNLEDPKSEVALLAGNPSSFRLLEALKTKPKVYYTSKRPWVRKIANNPGFAAEKEVKNG